MILLIYKSVSHSSILTYKNGNQPSNKVLILPVTRKNYFNDLAFSVKLENLFQTGNVMLINNKTQFV